MAGFFYAAPLTSLLLHLLDKTFFHLTDKIFLVFYFQMFVIFGLIGIALCAIGISKSKTKDSPINRKIGIAGVALGVFSLIANFVGIMLFVAD
jgi:hypothetical protein